MGFVDCTIRVIENNTADQLNWTLNGPDPATSQVQGPVEPLREGRQSLSGERVSSGS